VDKEGCSYFIPALDIIDTSGVRGLKITGIGAVLDAYGDLDHNPILETVYEKYPLETVYEKYPAYARKSRLRKGVSPKGRSRGRRVRK